MQCSIKVYYYIPMNNDLIFLWHGCSLMKWMQFCYNKCSSDNCIAFYTRFHIQGENAYEKYSFFLFATWGAYMRHWRYFFFSLTPWNIKRDPNYERKIWGTYCCDEHNRWSCNHLMIEKLLYIKTMWLQINSFFVRISYNLPLITTWSRPLTFSAALIHAGSDVMSWKYWYMSG